MGIILHDPSAKFKRTLGDRFIYCSCSKDLERLTELYNKQRNKGNKGNKDMKTKRFQDRVKCMMANRGVLEEISVNAPSFPVVEG